MPTKSAFPIVLLTTSLLACPAQDPSGDDEVGETAEDSSGDGDGDPDTTAGDGDGDGDGDTTMGDGDGDTTGDGDGDGDPVVDACEFSASAIAWPLPQEFVGADVYEQTTDSWGCNGGNEEYRYQLLDITGDGAVDFLVTDACDAAGTGTTHWEVFVNTGDGFADSSIDWALPQLLGGGSEFYEQITDSWGCNDGQTFRYQVLDLTGDGAVDFLLTDSCDATGVGTTHWEVYENTGSGFAVDPISWPLPQYLNGGSEFYEQISDSWGCNGGETFRYQLLDMTGDGAVDFLITDACDATGVGASNWLVHENTGTGFANEPLEWGLPQVFPGENEIYEQTADYWTCEGGEYRYQLLDITGDGAIDFLITDACDETGVGASKWQVLENTGTGFAAQPLEWALPTPLGDAELYEQIADDWPCDGERYRFQTLDLTGDHAPDLVVTDFCDVGGSGTDRWDVFKNVGTGFAPTAIDWSLPGVLDGTDLYEQLADYWGCNNDETFRYSVFDITGDGAPDLTATDLCDANGNGTTQWSVFAAVCE